MRGSLASMGVLLACAWASSSCGGDSESDATSTGGTGKGGSGGTSATGGSGNTGGGTAGAGVGGSGAGAGGNTSPCTTSENCKGSQGDQRCVSGYCEPCKSDADCGMGHCQVGYCIACLSDAPATSACNPRNAAKASSASSAAESTPKAAVVTLRTARPTRTGRAVSPAFKFGLTQSVPSAIRPARCTRNALRALMREAAVTAGAARTRSPPMPHVSGHALATSATSLSHPPGPRVSTGPTSGLPSSVPAAGREGPRYIVRMRG
jgi:hypothetical protein